MRMRAAVGVFALAMVSGWAERSEAVSAFANRYDVACHFCHDGYPKLNAMGQRFKERGFRMANEEPFDFERWAKTVPFTVRAIGTRFLVEDGDGFNVGFIKGVSAGNLGSRLSYWIDDGLAITEKDAAGDRFHHTRINNGWARIELVTGGKLYVKGGRFELDIPFTQARSPHLFPYEIYSVNTGFETDNIADYHHGVEVGGDLAGDVRWSAAVVAGRNPAAQEDIESLGARCILLPLAPGDAEDESGYAKELGEAFYARQQELMARVVAGVDVVITTALIPGAPAPTLITADAVAGMQPGSIIVDCAAERGGNCELTRADETVVTDNRVTILGPTNLPSTLPHDASLMYSKNIAALLGVIVKDGRLALDEEDEIVRGALVTKGGEIVNRRVREVLEEGRDD